MAYRIVNLGDSVPWGQGLKDEDKYDRGIQQALNPSYPGGADLDRHAHSGAVIDATAGRTALSGEVPVPRLTVVEQLQSVTTPETADLVLINGGINDVGVATILNPFAIVPPLSRRVHDACYTAMRALLQQACTRFTKPTCRIFVTGYYAILSDQSDPLGVEKLLHVYGVKVPDFIETETFHNIVVDRCEEFFSVSTAALTAAVRDAADPRIQFVPSGFTDANAMFVPGTSWLWGLTDTLGPEDPIAGQRAPQCDLTFDDVWDVLERETCYRASAGHPTPAGALQFKAQLLAALGPQSNVT